MDWESGSCETEDIDPMNFSWYYMPDAVLLHIFQHLSPKQLLDAGLSCKPWHRVSKDELLWKRLFYANFKIDPSINIAPGCSSWLEEYKRLCYHTPTVKTEELKEHCHQVLHVSFSHNGQLFSTCSKDGYVLVWSSNYPSSIKYQNDMKMFSWKYTQFSQFNQSDTLLLVSGVHFGTPHSTSGEIAVFGLQDGFPLQCRVMNKPYDIFGTWYSDHYLVSGDLHWLAHFVSTSVLWLNKASQETDSEHVPITKRLYRFYNTKASSIRSVTVANCLFSGSQENIPHVPPENSQERSEKEERGNPPSHREVSHMAAHPPPPQQLHQVSSRLLCSSLDAAFSNWRKVGDGLEYACPIQYNAEYREVENQDRRSVSTMESRSETDEDSNDDDDDDGLPEVQGRRVTSSSVLSEVCSSAAAAVEEETAEEEDDVLSNKLLIFTSGSKTYTPHQVGFKRVQSVSFPKKMSPGPSLEDRLAARERARGRSPQPEPNWLVYEEVADRFDKVDQVIDLHGHIIGMGLSPDHRYLYVNSRPWPQGYVIDSPLDPPPIAQEIDIHVIDLVTLKEVGIMLRSHKAYTPNNECFFIFLDVCEEYVASGSEDKHGYLWDRHYGTCLAKLPHIDVVNAVAFNPHDPEMLVTVSDDYTVKVWRSRNRATELGLDVNTLQRGVEIRRKAHSCSHSQT